MATQISNVTQIGTTSVQYLYRVYHLPIRRSRWNGVNVPEFVDEGYQPINADWSYGDFLASMPAESDKLIDMASRLAAADACILLGQGIIAVAIFMVEPGKPIDASTPTTVLHPFENKTVGYEFWNYYSEFTGAEFLDPIFHTSEDILRNDDARAYRAFQSYDLEYPELMGGVAAQTIDPYFALDVVRPCEVGRTQHQFIKGACGFYDYFRDEKGNMVLNPKSTLYRTRFPWYKWFIENLPYTHTGWEIKEDGHIEPAPVALTERYANLISDMAQQRRMFLRRKHAVSYCILAWHDCVRRVMEILRTDELTGGAEVITYESGPGTGQWISWSQVNTAHIKAACLKMVEFVNIVGIANGANSLLLYKPGATETQMHAEYTRIVNLLKDADDVFTPFPLKGKTKNWEILLSLIDLLGAVMNRVQQYASDLAHVNLHQDDDLVLNNVLVLTDKLNIHNQFALDWVGLQGDVQACLSLVFLWQVTWDVKEPTRGTGPDDVLKTDKTVDVGHRFHARGFKRYDPELSAPSIEGRFSYDQITLTPFRGWDVTLPPAGVTEASVAALQSISLAALADNLASVLAAEEARRAARKAAREAEIDALKIELAARSAVDPSDPYDYRNFTSKEWLFKPMADEQIPRFIARSLQTPDEITTIKDAFGLGKTIMAGVKRLEPIISTIKELRYPQLIARDLIERRFFQRLVYNEVSAVVEAKVNEYTGNVKTSIIATVANGGGTTYVPRQFFPAWEDPDVDLSGVGF